MAPPALPDEPALTLIARLRQRLGDRAIGIAVAVGIEVLLLLILLTLGTGITRPGEPDGPAITAFDVAPAAPPVEEESEATTAAEPVPEPAETQPTQQEQPPAPRPTVADVPAPPPPALVLPRPATIRPPTPATAPPAPPRRPPAAQGPVYGPPAPPAGAGVPGDTERVGSAPNGEPMYAARWYREPTDNELAGYLSTATGPGYGLIACKVVTGYRVEECTGISEQPQGSNLLRAVLAASWQFRVRPPRIGGKEQFGEWVRIQITYSNRQVPR
ncbi:hypothetical protein [Croceibacterium mercuriale]|uniref:hypothetical protein n=1 Tax=Croceibacterium mercuriale TaxID=1572751 RepID=UPI0009DFDB07|nr:hypothetical protein [Croceibacterium mercuriale]